MMNQRARQEIVYDDDDGGLIVLVRASIVRQSNWAPTTNEINDPSRASDLGSRSRHLLLLLSLMLFR